MKKAIAIALVLASAGSIAATTNVHAFSTLKLIQACESKKVQDEIVCKGVIGASVRMMGYLAIVWEPKTKYFCAPNTNIENEQLVRIVTTYARNNPDDLHVPAEAVIAVAISKAFPCR